MLKDKKNNNQENNFICELNEGFSNSWIFNVPIDLSFNKASNINDKETKFLEIKNNLSDNISRNYLPEDLINVMTPRSSSTFSSNEDSFSDTKNTNQSSQDEITRNSFSRFYSSFNQSQEGNNSLDEALNNENRINETKLSSYYEGEEIKEVNNNFIFKNLKNLDCKIIPISEKLIEEIQYQNCNINLYNPCMNYINICYPPSSSSSSSLVQDNNKMLNEHCFISNEKDNLVGKLSSKINYGNSNFIKNNIKFYVNNSSINTENLGDNFPTNFSQLEIGNNIIYNQDNNLINNNNRNNINKNLNNANSNINTNDKITPKVKKNKKKKKKKVDDEYTVEMFGRRGWICEGCNNFNYESRKKCNRCKIPKKPLKRTIILDNKGNKIIDNIINTNHKDDWNCYNCSNVNYAFRLNCNRCQSKRENFPNNENETEKKPTINIEN